MTITVFISNKIIIAVDNRARGVETVCLNPSLDRGAPVPVGTPSGPRCPPGFPRGPPANRAARHPTGAQPRRV